LFDQKTQSGTDALLVKCNCKKRESCERMSHRLLFGEQQKKDLACSKRDQREEKDEN